ncbi:venom acid phosphatase Acph-1 [Culicoides brevitarsis]|uniref:venom acid phosphatase Acph-1 n=1 Tax=Culicoides brevitarsis TaxID=469753 RepID=UPI00307CB515
MNSYFSKEKRGVTMTVLILGTALCAFMFAYLVFGDTNDEEAMRTIRMVGVVFRHGARNPTESYPNDPYLNYNWPGGLGALNKKGIKQMYNLGKNLNVRYYRLFEENGLYSQENMKVQSSSAERAIMSAQSFLAGFMPPLETNNPLPIPWQPAAVSVLPRDQDTLIAMKKPCPKYDETLKQLYLNPPSDIVEMNQKNENLYRMLSRNTGLNISRVLDVELLYNTLDVEKESGLELPDWTEQIFPDRMYPATLRSYTLFTETPYMKKIKGGALFTDILDKMIKKRNGLLSPNRSIFIYSGHDVTLVNIMHAMGILEETSRKPDYAATLVIELHHSYLYRDDMEVRIVYYYNSEDKFPKEIQIPGCDHPCSLTNFGKAMSNIVLREDYDEACKIVE